MTLQPCSEVKLRYNHSLLNTLDLTPPEPPYVGLIPVIMMRFGCIDTQKIRFRGHSVQHTYIDLTVLIGSLVRFSMVMRVVNLKNIIL